MSNWECIPNKAMLLNALANQQVENFMGLLAMEFRNESGDNDYLGKAVIEGDSAKWYVEVPYDIPVIVQHEIRDKMVEKGYDQVHFNKFGHFDSMYMRVSITIKFTEV